MRTSIISIILWIVISFSPSFASYPTSYTIKSKDKQKVEHIVQIMYTTVEKKYHSKKKRNYVYQSIVDTIDGYIVLHKLSERNKMVLLYLKTLLLLHMWYKIWNCIKLNVVK